MDVGSEEALEPEVFVRFEPPLWMQRRTKIGQLLHEQMDTVKSVLDLGCGEGSVLGYLVGDTQIELLAGVDCWRERVGFAETRLQPTDLDQQFPRETPLSIHLFHGSICDVDDRVCRDFQFDAMICTEVIEHLVPEHLVLFRQALFGVYRPPLVYITTPNSEYNIHFPPLDYRGPNQRFRDEDHKFEWTRAEFESWCQDIASEFHYDVEFTGVGVHSAGEYNPAVGYCTQIAVFKLHAESSLTQSMRTMHLQPNATPQSHNTPWNLVTTIVYPYTDFSHFTAEERRLAIEQELPFLVRWRYPDPEDQSDAYHQPNSSHPPVYILPLKDLWQVHRIRQVFRGDLSRLQQCMQTRQPHDAIGFNAETDEVMVSSAWPALVQPQQADMLLDEDGNGEKVESEDPWSSCSEHEKDADADTDEIPRRRPSPVPFTHWRVVAEWRPQDAGMEAVPVVEECAETGW